MVPSDPRSPTSVAGSPAAQGEAAVPSALQAVLEADPEARAWKQACDSRLAALLSREKQQERWFKTLDAHLRLLDRERQKFHALVNRSDASVMVLGADRRVRWANREAIRVRAPGEDPAAVVGRECHEVCGHAGGPCPDCPVERVLRGAAIAHQERREAFPDATREIYVTALPIRGPEGEVEEVLLTMQDLTDLAVLRRSESRLRQLFERSADAILMVEPRSMRIVLANPTAHLMLGSAGPGLVGRSLRHMLDRAGRRRLRALCRELLAGRRPAGLDLDMRTGSELLVCNLCGSRFDLDGADVVMLELRDVTAVRRMERELAEADRLASLGTMSAGIAHEFKNRLAPLRGLVQLLTQRADGPDRADRYAPRMLAELDRLANLVRDVLDSARPQVARRDLQDLARLTFVLADEFQREYLTEIAEQGIRVSCDAGAAGALPVQVDTDQIRAVFQNVLKNALEACGTGGSIQVSCAERPGRAVVCVRDTGCGMEPQVLARVHEPFFSTKGARGTGLGMCIVKSLVEANHGALELRSQRGKGTEVEMSFGLEDAGDLPARRGERAA